MKYEIATLEGALLDAAVAMAEGYPLDADGDRLDLAGRDNGGCPMPFRPSTDWNHAGPIIERESLAVFRQEWSDDSLREWKAGSSHDLDEGPKCSGPTPLIAAMRAYAASKFGETVELP
jgi:hypothetical protein